jgi:hypothetical protein
VQATAFWKAVLVDRANFLDRFLAFMARSGARYCVIGGTAVNAYAYPVVTQDLDVAVAAEQLDALIESLAGEFTVTRFVHSVNVSSADSDVRVQIQTDLRYSEFVGRSSEREVMGLRMPIARMEDVLEGKIWAALDSTSRPSKQLKALSDIARILEVAPDLRSRVPAEILARIPDQGRAPSS